MGAALKEKIDFVITWVDSKDAQWLSEKSKYSTAENKGNEVNRFRTWDNLQFWFRGVERFAPWVDRIHFVTFGHLPSWLNVNHHKLNIVRHEDYMPVECLPTFNSRSIEFYMHKIKDLGDKFVYFNDDMFIVSKIGQDSFFRNGKPCDEALLKSFYPNADYSRIIFNNLKVVNRHCNKNEAVCRNLSKWINYRYGLNACVNNILQLMHNKNDFSAIKDTHLPVAYTKSQFETVWNRFGDSIYETCKNKFRSLDDINHFVIRYWRLAQGDFYPEKIPGAYFGLSNLEECLAAAQAIVNKKTVMLCVNDVPSTGNYNKMKTIINDAFNKILPQKSKFEI